MRAPEERRLRKHLGRLHLPDDAAQIAAQREALAAAEAAQEEERVTAQAAAAEEKARAARRALRKKARAEHTAKAIKFLRCVCKEILDCFQASDLEAETAACISAMMDNRLRLSFVKWKHDVATEKAERLAAAAVAKAESARRRMTLRVERRDELRRGVISLCALGVNLQLQLTSLRKAGFGQSSSKLSVYTHPKFV